MNKLAELEDEKTERLRDLEEERDRMVNWVQRVQHERCAPRSTR